MLPMKSQGSQYIMSLDNLDLSFLSQYVEKFIEDEMPVWSKPVLDGESMLCEVEIISDNIDHDISYIESSNNIMCYICNLDIPQSYFKQHTKSVMHKNYTRLIETVLENVSKQITVDVDNNDTEDQHESFFCEICAKIVLVENRRKHLRSNYHLKCKENVNQIDVFLESYSKSRHVSNSHNINDDTTQNGILNHVQIDEIYNTEYNTASEYTDVSDDSGDKYMRVGYTPSNTAGESSNGDNTKNSIELTKDSLEFDLNDSICIETPKGFKEMVKKKNFHGYIECANFLYCLLCDKWLRTNTQEHNTSEDHLLNIKQPINDDFIRVTIDKKIRHCVLCNVTVATDSDHATVNPNHKKFKSSEVKNKNDSMTQKTFCEACDKYIDTHNFLGHTEGKNHKLKVKTKANKLEKNLTVNNQDQYCYICEVYIPCAGIQIHEAGKTHKKNTVHKLTEGMKCIEQYVHKIATNLSSNCTEPSTSEESLAISSYKNTDLAMTNQQKIEYKNCMTELSLTEMNCIICNSKVPNLPRNIVEHINGRNHKNNISVTLRENKITQISSQVYNCQYCNIDTSDFLKHINENNIHIKKRLMSGVIDKTQLKMYVYEFPTNSDILATVYRDIYKDLLKQNCIVELHNSIFYCNKCFIQLTRISEIDHMFGERHRSVVDKLSSKRLAMED